MTTRHVTDLLAGYCEGELSAEEARRVTRHLARCRRCARRYRQICLGVELARRIQPASMPEARAESIRQQLREPAPGDEGRRPWLTSRLPWQLAAAAATLVVLLAGIVLYSLLRPAVELRLAGRPLSGFEAAAHSVHLQLAEGETGLDLETDSPREARRWLLERTGLSANLASERPPADGDRFRIQGTKLVELPGVKAGAVAYRIDSHAVTLVVAQASRVPAAPAWGLFHKKILYHADPERGLHLLTWTSSGQTYTLVSDLPRLGRTSCFICHTDPGRRRLIDGMQLEARRPRR